MFHHSPLVCRAYNSAIVLLFWLAGSTLAVPADDVRMLDVPFHCYLTWQRDPATTLTVNFHTMNPHTAPDVWFDTVSRGGSPSMYRYRTSASTHEIPGLNDLPGAQRYIHVAEMTGLDPGAIVYFVAGSPDGGYTEQRSARLPGRTVDDLRFVVGGDMSTNSSVPGLLTAAAAESPQFGLIGGDIAYADGLLANWSLWDRWLQNWETYMVTPEGHDVPIILAIGNHEVIGGFQGYDDPLGRAPFFFGLFAQEGRGFEMERKAHFRRDFGANVALLVLDTGHVTSPGGPQADWLAAELASMSGVDLRMAAYHVPMYPSHRGYDSADSAILREVWLPLFDSGQLDVAFEHHDHMLKRTKRLRNNQPAEDGTLYLGDGCFGQAPRTGEQALALEDPAELAALGLAENYLAAWSPERHFWLVEAERATPSGPIELQFTALTAESEVADQTTVSIKPRGGVGSDGHCLISALFGSTPKKSMASIRSLRDHAMLTNPIGSAAADFYYRISPTIVRAADR